MSETVYLALYGYDYEGGELIGVYSTKAKAESALRDNVSRFADHSGVREVEIDTGVEISF